MVSRIFCLFFDFWKHANVILCFLFSLFARKNDRIETQRKNYVCSGFEKWQYKCTWWKIFREINCLVSSLVILAKTLISRNFFQKSVRAQCGNCGNSLSHFSDKNFVKVTFLVKKLLKSWFHEIFFRWERISVISTLWSVVDT